ncbi:MAG: hypothetical protein ACRCVK_03910, partial [Aeromonas veronii]
MKRLYLSKITLADGEAISAAERIIDSGALGADVAYNITTRINPDGSLGHPQALLIVDAKNHAALLADPDTYALPDFPFDAQIGAMHRATKDKMRTSIQARGFTLQELDDNADSYRGLVRA